MHRTGLVALFIAAALLLPGLAALASAQHCVVDLVVLNRNRHVVGDIDVLEVYELDPIRFAGVTWKINSELVATLRYANVEANVQCTDAWLCSGESPDWLRPTSGTHGVDDVYAELKVAVRLRAEE